MTIKEAYRVCVDAAYLGSEEDQKKHEKALQIIKDNLKVNVFVSTDIVADRFDNTEGYEDIDSLSYEDCKAIAELANQYICNSSLFDEIEERVDMAIADYVENEKN